MLDTGDMKPTRSRRRFAVGSAICTLAVIVALILAAVWQRGHSTTDITAVNPTAVATAGDSSALTSATAAGGIEAAKPVGGTSVALSVGSPDLGVTRLFVSLHRGGQMVAGARVEVSLAMPAFPSLGTTRYTLAPVAGGYLGTGSFAALGRWRATVRVALAGTGTPSEVWFDLLVGPGAGFVALPPLKARYGPATIAYTTAAGGSGDMRVCLRAGLKVRYVFAMPSMPEMGRSAFPMDAQAGGWYGGQIVFGMAGVTAITIQVLDHGAWRAARELLFDAGSTNKGVLFASSPIVP
jgi:hypothetical protein